MRRAQQRYGATTVGMLSAAANGTNTAHRVPVRALWLCLEQKKSADAAAAAKAATAISLEVGERKQASDFMTEVRPVSL